MSNRRGHAIWILPVLLAFVCSEPARSDQSGLSPDTAANGKTLAFDFPSVRVGIASYEEGPTGVTVFYFPDRATAAVDVRGGSPGTVNTDAIRLGYSSRNVDALVIAGGSSYGEEAITAVMAGLKDDGKRSGDWRNTAFATGAIIYDFFTHRLNEVYPDKRLALAAFHAARPNLFPLGAQGAGRMAMQGSFFGCAAHSGQGGAFRQIGETKIAAFVVVNASGTVTDRDGRMVSCHRDPAWGDARKTADVIEKVEAKLQPEGSATTGNTTISVVITNRKMSATDLQRLAVQVHTSMARAIQPFSTYDDGDTLFALSTQEVGNSATSIKFGEIDYVAAETMWDAILSSVPDEPAIDEPAIAVARDRLTQFAGRYRIGPSVILEISVDGDQLRARLEGESFWDLTDVPVPLFQSRSTASISRGDTTRTSTSQLSWTENPRG